jgi:hypothetical protein
MIMPAIFGAFGNFLLPTQLGVHDVAFPRLNSAAFWFLPGGLIMLLQLVCTDRRYARMNCFNIRELQGILKRKFFTDLVNSHDHKNLLEKSMIGLRYKTNSNINLDLDTLNFYNFGIHLNTNNNNLNYTNINLTSNSFLAKNYFLPMDLIFKKSYKFSYNFLIDLGSLASLLNINSFLCFPALNSLIKLFSSNFYFLSSFNYSKINNYNLSSNTKSENVSYVVESSNQLGVNNLEQQFLENTQSQRFTRFNNLLINYDYKTGHYIGN